MVALHCGAIGQSVPQAAVGASRPGHGRAPTQYPCTEGCRVLVNLWKLKNATYSLVHLLRVSEASGSYILSTNSRTYMNRVKCMSSSVFLMNELCFQV